MYYSFLYLYVTFIKTQWNLTKINESVNKTCKTHKKHSYWQDTNVYISGNKLAGGLKMGQTLEMYSSFLYLDVIILETECNLAKIDESFNKTCKTHKKHRIDRIQTFISMKIN